MSPKDFIITIKRRNILIRSCKVIDSIYARQRGQFLTRRLLASQVTVVPLCSETMVSLVSLPLPDDQNFLFQLSAHIYLTQFTYLLDYQISKILIKNTFNQTLHIPHYHKFDHLMDIAYKNCYLADTHSIRDAATFPPLSQHLSDHDAGFFLLLIDSSLKTV